ncbi:MAG: formylglycine-generating enzyme family protein, partial [Planctomycetota bacterium]
KAYEEALEKLSFLKQYQNVLGADLEMLKSLEDKIQYEYHLFLAKKAKQEKKWTKVIKELAIARQHGPDTLEILNWRREAKSELLKVAKAMEIDENWVEASKLYTLLVKYFPNDKKIQKSYKKSSYEFYLQKGNLNFAEIEWGMAYENYKKALQFNPKDTKILGRLKLMAHEQERYKKYKQFYRLASQLEKQKNWKEALEYYTKARKEMGILGGNARGLKEKIRITKKKWLEEQEKGYALYFNRGLKKLKSPNPYSATRDFEKALYYKQGDAEVLRYLAFAKTLKNMVYVPAGYFIMGRSRKDAQLDQNQTPENRIYLPGFYIDKYEVTNRQYRKFLTAIQRSHSHSEYCHPNEPKNKDHTPMYWTDPDYNQDDQPVVGVDWYDAYAFAKYVGKRLPTEQQWEKAARGSDGRLWPWGNKWNPNALNHYTTGPKKPTVVGSYPLGKSPYGCYDMAGNVWEWTDSKYAPYPNSLFKVPRKERNYYILRGGSWNDNEIYLADIRLTMTVFRFPKPRSLRGPHIGFRCVKLPLRQ